MAAVVTVGVEADARVVAGNEDISQPSQIEAA
jgi:hypothetical protein